MLNLNQFYKKSIKLVYSKTITDDFYKIYKNNYAKVKNFDELIKKFPNNLHPLFKTEIEKQYNNQNAIQSGLFTELSIFATLGQIYNISNFIWENSSYIYENDNWKLTLQGNLGHGDDELTKGNDILITDKINNVTYNCEVKEPTARLKERDVYYNEEGKLIPRDDFIGTQYIDIVNYFNNNFNVFNTIGHNTPIPECYVNQVIESYFSKIDYVFTYIRGVLAIIPNNKKLRDLIYDKTVSEIRTLNGKNGRVIFTPLYAQKILETYLIKEDQNNYYFNKNDFEFRSGRGTDEKGRYVLNEGFFISKKDAYFDGNILYCKKGFFKQNCPLISPKAKLKPTYTELKKILIEGGYNIDE